MNRYVTYCAQAKLLRLIERAEAKGVRIESYHNGWIGFELLFSLPPEDAIIINANPWVVTNDKTLHQLEKAAIDFSYLTNEFIFTRKQNVISSNAR